MVEPSPRTRRALRQLAGAQLTLERTRNELHDAIRADLDAGVTQAQLVRATGYTREHLRRIAHAAAAPRPELAQPRARRRDF